MHKPPLLEALDAIEIIHLPEREDRHCQLVRELRSIGLSIDDPQVRIPHAPRPDDAYGFPSRGVYGNFLSHLDILRRARDRAAPQVMVLEDDAIFRRSLRSPAFQRRVVGELRQPGWGMCFLGHSLRLPPNQSPQLLVDSRDHFRWAHCYIVRGDCLAPLVRFLEEVIERPRGHPLGGKMYIDGAFCLFRDQHPQFRTLVAQPVLSNQRGSPSSLGSRRWYHHAPLVETIAEAARGVRDEMWRQTGVQLFGHTRR